MEVVRLTPRLKEKYFNEIAATMKSDHNLKNINEVPRIEKIVVNMGVGAATQDGKLIDAALEDLALITGQKPKLNRARKSVAGFKLRAGMPIGCKVTLRGDRMYEFLDRLLSSALPRIRDFRGLPRKAFDKFGNYTFGVDEQLIFPEIEYDKVVKTMGMDITFVINSKDPDMSLDLLVRMGFPFKAA